MFTFPALSDKAKELLAKVLGLIICGLLVWAVVAIFQAKNAKIESLNEKLTISTAANKALKEELEKKDKSGKVTQNAISDTKAVEDKITATKDQAVQVVSEEVKEIKEKYIHLDPTLENEARKIEEISAARARSLWTTFCMQEPDNVTCKWEKLWHELFFYCYSP